MVSLLTLVRAGLFPFSLGSDDDGVEGWAPSGGSAPACRVAPWTYALNR